MSENSESDHYTILGEAIKCLILSDQKAKPPNYSIYYNGRPRKKQFLTFENLTFENLNHYMFAYLFEGI